MTTASETGVPRTAARARDMAAAITLLAVAMAIIVTSEFIAVGLLPAMARDLQISLSEAGRFVAWFAISAAVLGPLLTIVAGRREPRFVIILTLIVYAFGNLVIAWVPDDRIIVLVRVIQGAMLPVFISVGNAAVARLAGAGREGKAISLVNIGTITAIVFAVPAGTALADRTGWPFCFLLLAGLAIVAAIVTGMRFPRLDGGKPVSARAQVALLASPAFLAHLLLSTVLFTAMFSAYTYLAGFLQSAAGFDGAQTAIALFGFGAAGLFGNLVAGWAVDRAMMMATMGLVALLALTNAMVSLTGGQLAWLVPLLAIWGVAHGAAFVLCQVRVMRAGVDAPAFALSLNIAVCNLGIALGALVGGWVVADYGVTAIGYGGAAFALLALAVTVTIGMTRRL
ncbi:MFS transporter [Pseudorhodoplanes sinuspersici]|nr:MFS transporter [Pseudorhodoplanes sinuspersici]RKE70301.1 putative MFS family arabinose efflux permease [Pseudorhodoplanes sinuspersici]